MRLEIKTTNKDMAKTTTQINMIKSSICVFGGKNPLEPSGFRVLRIMLRIVNEKIPIANEVMSIPTPVFITFSARE